MFRTFLQYDCELANEYSIRSFYLFPQWQVCEFGDRLIHIATAATAAEARRLAAAKPGAIAVFRSARVTRDRWEDEF